MASQDDRSPARSRGSGLLAAAPGKTAKSGAKHAESGHLRSRRAKNKGALEDAGGDTLRRKLYQLRRVTFVLGAILGLIATAVLTAMLSDNIKLELDKLIKYDSFGDLVEDWKYLIPQGLQLIVDGYDQRGQTELKGSAESFSVGLRMKQQLALTPKHNVVMVPGVISTGLESWGVSTAGECPALPHFRRRLWGSFYMLRTMFLDKACWLKHIKLDPATGLDPPGTKVRASSGFDAADFFVAGYWIWNKILQNLAVVGYGPENMLSATYDWRLAYRDLERRDAYFTKLKLQIETTKRLTGEKSYLVGHSMGSQVIMFFLKWAEASGDAFGNGGPSWCNDHLAGVVDISGSLLGTPKAISALLSGEMKDTVQLNYLAVYGLEKFFSKRERLDLIRTFGGIPSMIPRGGAAIWGNATHSPDDPGNALLTDDTGVTVAGPKNRTLGKFIRYRSRDKASRGTAGISSDDEDFTLEQSIDKLFELSPQWLTSRIKDNYSFGIARTAEELEANNQDPLKWSNPLEAALPNAPDMKIFCLYGVGNPTERAYTYKKGEKGSGLPLVIDTESDHPVYFSDGDGTVSLLTHLICHEWQKENSRFNPAGIEVKIVEMKHQPDTFDIRGGAKTAEHVDILGSAELNELILKIVTGHGDSIENNYVSELRNISLKMEI
ncbi:LACT-domain-containing protein [Metschnikowia bicuspidata var. bicuspidata NRRL YB-4993]|uniref:LACT-domain-containing protein n=1 Tax=Metschnikowia bicuspidata var. bicuspidata NRRL YB-4993 TaxID=869754 RepID=A0A1A0HDP6_9ASCO|nr:LACT-domain-containing protein [Metschnikowia bicuspidata var. bicuspidata NRRL YB-4993]OBA22100.1 LACT-domain-containing protein [Metschnikowia bicuspidata var. bicuspidata NRRL YB-4993]